MLQLRYVGGRAIAQAVSRWFPHAASQVRCRVWSSGICGGQKGAGEGFLRVLRFSLPIFISPIAPQSPSLICEISFCYFVNWPTSFLLTSEYLMRRCLLSHILWEGIMMVQYPISKSGWIQIAPEYERSVYGMPSLSLYHSLAPKKDRLDSYFKGLSTRGCCCVHINILAAEMGFDVLMNS
jgi:hypothetical protein